MDLALKLNPFNDSDVLYAQQLGVKHIIANLPCWDLKTIAHAANRIKQAGLSLSALDCLPDNLLSVAFSDSPQRETALDQICGIITEMGHLDIPALSYRFPLPGAADIVRTAPVRGDAISTIYPPKAPPLSETVSRDVIWQLLKDVLQRLLPVAERSGVQLAYQTDLSLLAVPEDQRFPNNIADVDKLFEIAPDANHRLDLDFGYLTQVLAKTAGLRPTEVIRHYASEGRLSSIRIRSFQETDSGLQELFLDEDTADIIHALQACKAAGYDGLLCPIPAPEMTDDTPWRHKGHAFSAGYLRGLLQVLTGITNTHARTQQA